ncbi:hypothetical protein A3K73_09450 [Candidatus Pacearchaeota archaeon RBG_13_36_9]|nr:MAG: hypothetical protein A3K73_09450 [Candidatus Pacearchaeota archaeon RBG_13_36_9]
MKREKIIGILLLVFLFPLASAFLYENSPKFMVEKADFETSESQSLYSQLADGGLKVDVIWPLPGYYYVTDFLQIAVYTNKIANCTYDFSSSISGMYENGTYHWDYIYNLADNMEGEPYEIDFECTDSLSTEYNDTWFWINNTEYLDRYLLREGIGSYEYRGAELSWEGNDNGLLQVYGAVYKKNSASTFVQFLVFDDASSVSDFISNEVVLNIEDNYSIIVINKSNMYFVQEGKDKYYIWNSKNFLVSMVVYSLVNSSVDAPTEVINAYLGKYPGELRNGICGDEKTDILNEEGLTEECDKNSLQRDCGNNIGECKKGKETRICNSNCTWGRWGNCTAVVPKKEICDGKDNDCDNRTDEDFSNLGKNCSAGTGACFKEGSYVCSTDKLSAKCSATAGTPSKENCTDTLDNDCDGLKDFKDPECILFKLISPVNKSVYSQNKILFDIILGYEMDELGFSYFEERGREKETRLCRECSSYNKNYTFKDGKYNLNISSMDNGTTAESKQVSFIVDSTPPKISRMLPKKNSFTNGSNFYLRYTEENLKEVLVTYNPTVIIRSCNKSGKDQECWFSVNLKAHDGKEIEYSVNISDIAKHTTESRPVKIKVDTTAPKINNLKNMLERTDGSYAYFKINITEINLDKVEYYDNNDTRARWRTACSRLTEGICEKKIRFIGSKVNMTIAVIDKAGNSQIVKIP